MANPTTNFGWVMPTSSSLVTNLPADFNTFGQAVDTSMSELLGGTTGQVLSKTSNTNMDFTWVTPTDQTPLTTKGDLFTFSTVDARLGVGTNGQYLQADSTAATGLKWATASAPTWTSWTPTWTNFTIGNGTQSAAYRNYGDIVDIVIKVGFGSTTSISGNVTFALPFEAHSSMANWFDFAAMLNDAGTDYVYGGIWIVDVNTGRFTCAGAGGTYVALANVNATTPFTWTTNDNFEFFFSYRKA